MAKCQTARIGASRLPASPPSPLRHKANFFHFDFLAFLVDRRLFLSRVKRFGLEGRPARFRFCNFRRSHRTTLNNLALEGSCHSYCIRGVQCDGLCVAVGMLSLLLKTAALRHTAPQGRVGIGCLCSNLCFFAQQCEDTALRGPLTLKGKQTGTLMGDVLSLPFTCKIRSSQGFRISRNTSARYCVSIRVSSG